MVVGFSAGFFGEFEVGDDDGRVGGLAHVVKSESGDGSTGEGFHFDAGAGGCFGGGGDEEGFCVMRGDLDFRRIEGKRVAEGNEVRGFFGAHDSGKNGRLQNRAFFVSKLAVVHLREELATEGDEAGGGGHADGLGFRGDVNHAGLVGVIEVGQVGHGRSLQRGWFRCNGKCFKFLKMMASPCVRFLGLRKDRTVASLAPMKLILCLCPPVFLILAAIAGKIQAPAEHWGIVEAKGEALPRHEHAFVKVKDRFYLLGGRRVQEVDIFDPAKKEWTKGRKPPVELHHFQALEHEGRVLIAGAFTGRYPKETPVERIYFYDPANDRWSLGPVIPEDRRRGSAGAFLKDKKLYLVCGLTDGHRSGWVTWFDEYDFETEKWRKLPDAPRARDHFQAALVGDELVLAGGRRSGEGGSVFAPVVKDVDVFNFKTGAWETLPGGIPTLRAGTMSAVIGNEVWVIGGESARDDAHTEVEILEMKTRQWASGPSLDVGRHATQPIFHKGTLYLGAGSVTRGGTETNSLIRLLGSAGKRND